MIIPKKVELHAILGIHMKNNNLMLRRNTKLL